MTTINTTTSIEALSKLASSLGAESVKGELARPKFGKALCEAVSQGTVNVDGAGDMINTYFTARLKEQGKNTLAQGENDKSAAVQKSKFLALAKLGALPGVDGYAVLERALALREKLIGTDAKLEQTFEGMVKLSRAQCGSPEHELSTSDIEAALCKAEAEEKGLMEKLVADYKSMAKRIELATETAPGVVPALEDAMRAIGDAIGELGGDLPATTKEERAAQKAVAFLKSQGFSVQPNH